MEEEMMVDEAGSLRAAVTIVDAKKGAVRRSRGGGGKRTRLELALVLEQVVGLNDGHGEVTKDVVTRVSEPQEPILTASTSILVVVVRASRPETGIEKVHQGREHLSSLISYHNRISHSTQQHNNEMGPTAQESNNIRKSKPIERNSTNYKVALISFKNGNFTFW
ncbi:hypothetical protein DY000_02028207 [Brassica cretica]|uniref:Uncharacterized protein n=1 Tax=Brassica cretica TaxID=69181 RepID=A0ABQ7ELS1_BRACR|nr:hypothetical protein DY000_02028207 [Brassica cretica]